MTLTLPFCKYIDRFMAYRAARRGQLAQRKGHAAKADRVHGCANRRAGVRVVRADGGGD